MTDTTPEPPAGRAIIRRMVVTATPQVRHDWSVEEVEAVLAQPFADLLHLAQTTHRAHFEPTVIEGAILSSIKTGACPEDCAYCPQSAVHLTGLTPEPLLDTAVIVEQARAAKANGATRFCMGAAWRAPNDRQLESVAETVDAVGALGMETCVTLGMLTGPQAERLAEVGLDFYNHNLDTSPEFYGEIITTRTYADRLETLEHCRDAGLRLCTGGIVGMGESRRDRAGLLVELATLEPHPESVPINLLIKVPGTPLAEVDDLDGLELVRTIAAARVLMPTTVVRLSAGRAAMSDELQALCFQAGANSIFLGDKLLTADNAGDDADGELLGRLGMTVATEPVRPRLG